MILNKLWSVAKKLSHSGNENDKLLVGEKMLVVDTSDRKKRSRHLHFFVGFGIAAIFAIFLLLLIALISLAFDYPVCLTCFPSLAEKISKKLTHNTHLDSKYEHTIRNSKIFSEKASNTSVIETAGKVTSTETPILINLNKQSVIIRGKNTVPEKIWMLEDTLIYNVSETELPQKISVNERKYDSKNNITKDMHQINRDVPFAVVKLSSLYNDSSNSNFLLRNKLKKFPLKVPTVKNVSAIKSKRKSVTSVPDPWTSNDRILMFFPKTKFGKDTVEKRKKTIMHSGLESTPRVNPVYKNESESLTNNGGNVSENLSVSYYPIESSAAGKVSLIKNDIEGDPSVQDQWASKEMIFPSVSETTIVEYQLGETEIADMHSGLNLTHWKNRAFKNESENPFNIGRIVDEHLSRSYHPIKTSDVEKVSAIKKVFEDDLPVQDQWTTNDMIFLPLSETTFDKQLQEETEKTEMSDTHSGYELVHRINRAIKNEYIPNIDNNVEELLSISYYPIETSAVENISVIKDKNEDDTSVLGQLISNDITFLPLSETTFDEHLQEEETRKTDMHRVNEVLRNESENPSNIDRSVEENPSVSDYPIETSAVENVLATKSEFQGHPFVLDQWTSNDLIFQFLSQPQYDKQITEEKEQTKLDSGLELTSWIHTTFQNEKENVPKIDGSVGENLSISYYLTKTSDDESASVLKNEDEDFRYVLDPWTSNDKLIMGLSETTISKHLIEEKEKNNIHSSLNLSPRKSPAFQNKINISPKLFFSVSENLRIFQDPLKTEMKDNKIHINTKGDIKNMKNNIQKLSSSISTLQINSVDVQDLNKLLETDDCFLDNSFSVKGISSYFLRSLFPILESDKFDTQHAETENELAKLAKENENEKKLLPNSEIISTSWQEFSVEVHAEDPFLLEREEANFNTLATSTEDIFHYNSQLSDFETQ